MSFVSNIGTILRGSILAQLIGLAILPLLSRLYAPEDFGVVQALNGALSMLLIVSSLRLEVSLLSTPESRLESTWHCAAWFSVLTSIGALVVVAVLSTTTNLLHKVTPVVWILPLTALLAGWNQLGGYLSLRRAAFSTVSMSRVMQSGAFASAVVAAGVVRASPVGFMASDALGRLASVVYLVRKLGLRSRDLLRPPPRKEIVDVLRENRELTTIGLAAAVVNALGSSLTALLMLWVFNAQDAGQYAILERVIGVPVGLIAGAASQVFMSHLSRALTGPTPGVEARQLFRQVVALKFKVGIVPAVIMFFAAPWLVPAVLGQEWQQAGHFARAMTLLYFMSFVTSPVNMALTVANRQRAQLAWDFGRLVVTAGLWLCIWRLQVDAMHAIWLHATMATGCYIVYLVIADSALGRVTPTIPGTDNPRDPA